ncbi:MAG: stalk domain-containing protein [Defluviitaleaceae bacterium]|nr:stalk domain-containing protein [Defluviitaleaceae bacterium]
MKRLVFRNFGKVLAILLVFALLPISGLAVFARDATTLLDEPIVIRVGTYNTNWGGYNHGAEHNFTPDQADETFANLQSMGRLIQSLGIDIVGIQENDYQATRSGYVHVPRVIAQAAGMPHHVFYHSITQGEEEFYARVAAEQFTGAIELKSRAYQDLGWYYGNANISNFPIVSTTFTILPSVRESDGQHMEPRALLHSVIDVNGTHINFFNTHLINFSADPSGEVREAQMAAVNETVQQHRPFILVGDFNIHSFDEYNALTNVHLASTAENPINTFPGGSVGGYYLDNIVISNDLLFSHIGVSDANYSDHLLVYADIIIPPAPLTTPPPPPALIPGFLTLRVGSLNTNWGGYNIEDFRVFTVDEDYRVLPNLQSMGRAAATVHLDILGIQENDVGERGARAWRDVPQIIADAAGMTYLAFEHSITQGRDLFDERIAAGMFAGPVELFYPQYYDLGWYYGNANLSHFPIVSTTLTLLPNVRATTGQALEPRALLHSVIDVNGTYVNFFNTHLTHHFAADLEGEVRGTQMATLEEIIHNYRPFIFAGDFNIFSFDEYEAITRVTMATTFDFPLNTFPWGTAGHGALGGSFLDNILVSDDIYMRNVGLWYADYSDHLLIFADILMPLGEYTSVRTAADGNGNFIERATNRTMVPLDFFETALGTNVSHNAATGAITIERAGQTVNLQVGEALTQGMGAATVIDGVVYVPLAFAARTLGANVGWHAATREVSILIAD